MQNVERGITYTYIVPYSDAVKGILPGLQQIFKSHPEQLRLIQLREEHFRLLTVTHIAILNADMNQGQPPEVFMELPIEDTGTRRSRGYWIKVATDAALAMTGRFRKIVEDGAA